VDYSKQYGKLGCMNKKFKVFFLEFIGKKAYAAKLATLGIFAGSSISNGCHHFKL
jgi:hypothetical protein